MKRLTCLTLLSVLFNPPYTLADDAQKPAPILEEMVVTATRFPAKQATIPAHITTITAAQIQNSPAGNIPDLLRSQSGIMVSNMTGNGRSFTVDLRGFGESAGTNTLVLVDGRRINQADLGGTDWMQIPLERVEKIEIIRGGSGGVLYGDNASGGVVNIITKEGDGPFTTNLKVAAGTYGKASTHLGFSGTNNKLSYALDTGYRTDDGYRDNSDAQASQAGLKLKYDANDALSIHLSAGYQKDDVGFPSTLKESDFTAGRNRQQTITPDDFGNTKDLFVQLRPEFQFGQNNLFSWDLAWRNRDVKNYSNFTGGQFTGETATDVWSMAPRVQFNQPIMGMHDQLTLGMDYQSDTEKIDNESLFFGAWTFGDFTLRKITTGHYLHNEIRLSDQWRFTQGIRRDRVKFNFRPSTPEHVTMDADAFSGEIGYTYEHNNRVYLNFSRSFRYPLLDEQYSFFTNTVNTALQPQRTREFQLGSHYEFSPTLKGDISLFRLETSKEIYFDIQTFNNTNLDGEVRRDGVEMELAKQFENWSITGNATWTQAKIEAGTYAGKAFPGVPKIKTGLTVKYFPTEELTLEVAGRTIGSRPFISDFGNNFGSQSGHVVLDTALRYRWPSITGFINITNLTGTEYAEYGVLGGFPTEKAYFPSPKQGIMVGASTHF